MALLRSVGIPEPNAGCWAYPARVVRRHAPARHDRHRPGVWPQTDPRRRAHHRSRRHGAGPDPRPPGRPATRTPDGHDPRHPRPRGGGQPHRRDRRHVRREGRRGGPTPELFDEMRHALHRGAAAFDPPVGRGLPHAAARHPGPAPRPRRGDHGMPLRAALSLCPGPVPHRGAPCCDSAHGGDPSRCWYPVGSPRR